MSNPYILMWLEGPLQSWGIDSRYGRRDTLNFPTKSGVLGIICAALGAGGAQNELLSEFVDSKLQILTFPITSNNNNRNTGTTLKDFHTIGSGYQENDPWEALLIPKTSEGKKAVGGGTKLTYRHYLQDMAFAALLQVPTNRTEAIEKALISPVWNLSLGRKCCVPTEFIYQGTFNNLESAQEKATKIATKKSRHLAFRVEEGVLDGDETFTLNDVPIQFGTDKRYQDRQVTLFYPDEDND